MKNTVKKILKPKKMKWEQFYSDTMNTDIQNNENKPHPEWSKTYFKAYARMPSISLPKPTSIQTPLTQSIIDRKSTRDFDKRNTVSLSKLSTLLFYSLGINPYREDSSYRFYPSGGARYPIEGYLISLDINGLDQYLYHYYVRTHILEKLFPVTKKPLKKLFLYDFPLEASGIIVLTGIMNRTTMKYKDRGYNYALLEAGHISQNIYLLASALNINCCSLGGFFEKPLADLLDINFSEEKPIYTIALK